MRAENLDSAILVMKAAENRSRCDGAEPLNRPMNGSVLAQSSMSPRFIVISDKLAKDPAQMGLTEHNQVVETFPSDRADQNRHRFALCPIAFHSKNPPTGTMQRRLRYASRNVGKRPPVYGGPFPSISRWSERKVC